MQSEWGRYTEVTLTEDEAERLRDYGPPLDRDGHNIELLCSTDNDDDTYGMEDDDGELLVAGAGFCYQTWHDSDWYELLDSLVERYGGHRLADTYAQCVTISLPPDDDDASILIRLLDAITHQAMDEFAEREAARAKSH